MSRRIVAAADRRAPVPSLTPTPSGRRSSVDPLTPLINVDGVESSTNELPLSAITFGSRGCSVWGAGRRQRHGIAGQMSYLKMLGLGARGKLSSAAALFSTAVISGSSSAPNLRVMIPASSSTNAALEGFGGVPAIRPLETLHNALSLRQLDAFLERVAAAPVLLHTPPAHDTHKHPSPTNSVGWSGPSSLMSSSGELPSGLSSAGPSSPNSNYACNSEHKNISESSNWSREASKHAWAGDAATLCDRAVHSHRSAPGSSISGDVTPVSVASELEFNSNEATAGSVTDHELLSAEEEDEETLSGDACGSPMKMIRNDLSPHSHTGLTLLLDNSLSHSTDTFYGLNLQQTKETFYKDMPSSSKNFNVEHDKKCSKEDIPQLYSDLDSLNLQSTSKGKYKRSELLNNGSRRYSDSSAQKSSQGHASGSRFKTTLVAEDLLRPSTSSEITPNNNAAGAGAGPSVTKSNNVKVKPGFSISDT